MGSATESEVRGAGARRLVEGDVLAGKYRIEAVLGEGGMGAVYRALHLATKKRVAIKTMHARYAADDAWVTRFTREAQAAGRIHHPNVVDVYDVGRDGSTPFLVMELLRGVPLSAILEEEGCLPPATLIDLIMPALRGIAAAHAEGIVHRDLKPENVFLVHDARGDIAGAKVLDFGISKAREDEPSTSLTKTGTVMGTPHYMSLEQIRGRRDVDARTDVYSVGVILYRALSGELPFDADTFPALAVEIATAEVLPLRSYLPDLDPALAAVVARAMERERDRRFESIEALALALEPFGTVRFEERGRSIRGAAPKALASSVETAPTLERAAPAEAIAEVAVTGERKIAKPISDPAPAPTPAPRPSRARLWIGASAALVVLASAIGFAIWLSVGGLSAPSTEIDRHAEPRDPPPPVPAAVPATEPPPRLELVEPTAPPAAEPAVEALPEGDDPPADRRQRAPRGESREPAAREPSPGPDEPAERVRTGSGVRTSGVSVDEF